MSTYTEKCSQLHNLMGVSARAGHSHELMSRYIVAPKVLTRFQICEWMKKILGKNHAAARDTSIQIFDKFMLNAFAENPQILRDADFIVYAATASAILSSKLLDSRSKLSVSLFPEFDPSDLHNFERHILTSAAIGISPMCSPTNFAKLISDLSASHKELQRQQQPQHVIEVVGQQQLQNQLLQDDDRIMQEVNSLIGEFWEAEESLMYAPATIAISALLLAYSLCHLDFSTVMDSLPDFFIFGNKNDNGSSSSSADCGLANTATSIDDNHGRYFADIDSCIVAFERIPILRESKKAASPASVMDMK